MKSDIKQVKATWDEEEANLLISQGWIVMHAGIAHRDGEGFMAKPCYILARKERSKS